MSLRVVLLRFIYHPAPTEIYPLSLHDALPIFPGEPLPETTGEVGIDLGLTHFAVLSNGKKIASPKFLRRAERRRSEEHTSELQSRENLVCRLLLEKKKNTTID